MESKGQNFQDIAFSILNSKWPFLMTHLCLPDICKKTAYKQINPWTVYRSYDMKTQILKQCIGCHLKDTLSSADTMISIFQITKQMSEDKKEDRTVGNRH